MVFAISREIDFPVQQEQTVEYFDHIHVSVSPKSFISPSSATMAWDDNESSPERPPHRKSRDDLDTSKVLPTRTRPSANRVPTTKQKTNGECVFSHCCCIVLSSPPDENTQQKTIEQLQKELKHYRKVVMKTATNRGTQNYILYIPFEALNARALSHRFQIGQ
jgi:hypothetical protein